MTAVARRLRLMLCCLVVGLPPAVVNAHVTATGLAVVGVEGREVSYRLTVVPSELPETISQLLSRAMDGSRPDAEQFAEKIKQAVLVRVDGEPCRPGRVAVQDVGTGL